MATPFFGGKEGETEYSYEPEKWRTETSDWKDEVPSEEQLQESQNILIRIENVESGGIAYNTLTGPFDGYDTVTEICEDNWGPDGYELQ